MKEEAIKFLADESCDFAVVKTLRSAGYDVVAISELSPSIPDLQVLRLAVEEKRILLAEDKKQVTALKKMLFYLGALL